MRPLREKRSIMRVFACNGQCPPYRQRGWVVANPLGKRQSYCDPKC